MVKIFDYIKINKSMEKGYTDGPQILFGVYFNIKHKVELL